MSPEEKRELNMLKLKVEKLEKLLGDKTFLQQDFSKRQIVKRRVTFKDEVIFEKPVYNAAGTKVIN